MIRPAAAGMAWAIAGVMLVAQDPQAPLFRAGTNIVRVDATVVDRNGNPVSSLTADDFEIREDGVPQTISSFKVPVDAAPAGRIGFGGHLTRIDPSGVTVVQRDIRSGGHRQASGATDGVDPTAGAAD